MTRTINQTYDNLQHARAILTLEPATVDNLNHTDEQTSSSNRIELFYTWKRQLYDMTINESATLKKSYFCLINL